MAAEEVTPERTQPAPYARRPRGNTTHRERIIELLRERPDMPVTEIRIALSYRNADETVRQLWYAGTLRRTKHGNRFVYRVAND